jgi:hypothetical protein
MYGQSVRYYLYIYIFDLFIYICLKQLISIRSVLEMCCTCPPLGFSEYLNHVVSLLPNSLLVGHPCIDIDILLGPLCACHAPVLTTSNGNCPDPLPSQCLQKARETVSLTAKKVWKRRNV